MSSLALLAAGAEADGDVAAAVDGGHGELFVQQFDGRTLEAKSDLLNLPPSEAAELHRRRTGRWAGCERTGRSARAGAGLPPAGRARRTRCGFPNRCGPCRLSRSTRARRTRGRGMRHERGRGIERRTPGDAAADRVDLDSVIQVMNAAFDERFGEAWTRSQCAGILPMPGVKLVVARFGDGRSVGFSLVPDDRRRGRAPPARRFPGISPARNRPDASRSVHRPCPRPRGEPRSPRSS